MKIKENLKYLSEKIIKSWDQRIECEIQLIKTNMKKLSHEYCSCCFPSWHRRVQKNF